MNYCNPFLKANRSVEKVPLQVLKNGVKKVIESSRTNNPTAGGYISLTTRAGSRRMSSAV